MKFIKNNGVLAACVALIVCLSAVCLSTSQPDNKNRYEIRPEVSVPESRTDTARIIDAYERLMDKYMASIESNGAGLTAEIGNIGTKLEVIDRKISLLSSQLETIQIKLGIAPPPKPSEKPINDQDPNRTDKAGSESKK